MASFLAHSFARQTVWLEEPAIRSMEELLDIKEALEEFGDDIVASATSRRHDSVSVLSDDVTGSSSNCNSNPSSSSGKRASKEVDCETADTYIQDGSNDLTCKDLYSVFQTVGTSKSIQRCQEMLDKCTIKGYSATNSSRGAGSVKAELDFPDLIQTLLEEMQETITYDDLRKAFDIMDTDKDGKISVKNMSQISSGFGEEQISEQELETMIKAVDREGTGLVTFEQFSSIINPPNEMSDGGSK